MSAETPNRIERHRDRTRGHLLAAARLALSFTGEVTPRVVTDICEQVGLHPTAFKSFYPTHDALLDAVNEALVQECASRLRSGVAHFRVPEDPDAALRAAALALAASRPIERAGLLIRARRRASALASTAEASQVSAADKRFSVVLAGTLTDLLEKLGRRFEWDTGLAVRVILDSYERSFEAWVLSGNNEAAFERSPFVQHSLPELLKRTSARISSRAMSRAPVIVASRSQSD